MAIDIVTGVIHSAIELKVSSKIEYRGFLKKATIMLVIIVANLLDLLTVGGIPVFLTMQCSFTLEWKVYQSLRI